MLLADATAVFVLHLLVLLRSKVTDILNKYFLSRHPVASVHTLTKTHARSWDLSKSHKRSLSNHPLRFSNASVTCAWEFKVHVFCWPSQVPSFQYAQSLYFHPDFVEGNDNTIKTLGWCDFSTLFLIPTSPLLQRLAGFTKSGCLLPWSQWPQILKVIRECLSMTQSLFLTGSGWSQIPQTFHATVLALLPPSPETKAPSAKAKIRKPIQADELCSVSQSVPKPSFSLPQFTHSSTIPLVPTWGQW